MTKKQTFFTLIEGAKVKVAPGVKVIPAEELGTLLQASDIADKMAEEVATLRTQTEQECVKIKKQAYEKGFAEGQQAWAQQVTLLEEEIQQVHDELKKVVVPVALQAAKKIVGREMKLNPETIVDIVANNLKAVATHKRIVIYVNREDFALFEEHKPQLKSLFEGLESLTVMVGKEVQKNGCVIETEGGIINAQIDNQWELLQQAFEAVMKTKLAAMDEEA